VAYDWLIHYDEMKEWILEWVGRYDYVVDMGCGNSLLVERMRSEGYHHVVGCDYSMPGLLRDCCGGWECAVAFGTALLTASSTKVFWTQC
jgi:hypothetical protein